MNVERTDWPQSWDLSPLYSGLGDERLGNDIAAIDAKSAGWQRAARRAAGYLFLLLASGVGDVRTDRDVARCFAQLQRDAQTAADRFTADWKADLSEGLPHPLTRAALAMGLCWRRLVLARDDLAALAEQFQRSATLTKLPGLNWNNCVALSLEGFENPDERDIAVQLIANRHVDALARPRKLSRPFCMAPDPAIGPFVSMRAGGTLIDALVLAHELRHAVDEISAGVPPPTLTAEMSARQAERRLFETVAVRFGTDNAVSLLLERQRSEIVGPLKTLVAQIDAAQTFLTTGRLTSNAAFEVPPLYPVAHITSTLSAFTDLAMPEETAVLYRNAEKLFKTISAA